MSDVPSETAEISTSSRSTWVWSPDALHADAVRSVLESAGHAWRVAWRRGSPVAHVTDVDIGVDALGAVGSLVDAGYVLRWHAEQHSTGRGDTFMGYLIGDTAG